MSPFINVLLFFPINFRRCYLLFEREFPDKTEIFSRNLAKKVFWPGKKRLAAQKIVTKQEELWRAWKLIFFTLKNEKKKILPQAIFIYTKIVISTYFKKAKFRISFQKV